MRRTLAAAIATALAAAASPSSAVMLNPRGTGQVLIYPYYTVNHQQTLVSVINTTAHGKALKVRFREGYDGRDVANFNVYLGPYDSWVGAVYDTSADGTGAAAIATNDNSCTVPAFPLAPVPGTLHALPFSNANYSQGAYGATTGADSGPVGLSRTREGFFEIIEMGEVVDQANGSQKTLEAITPVSGIPLGCAQVQGAWASNGYWKANSSIDLSPPAGGVYGAAGFVNVAQGTLYAYDATAIDGFSDHAQHTGPGDAKPNLSTAITDSPQNVATAYVPIGNAMIKADYPASTRGVDAVTAVLMADALYNEFDIEAQAGASSDWVVTFPTKQFYVDPAIVGFLADDYLPPFEEVFGGGIAGTGASDPGYACATVDAEFRSREGYLERQYICGVPPLGPGGNYLCYETQVVTIGKDGIDAPDTSLLNSSLLMPLYVFGCGATPYLLSTSGNLTVALTGADYPHTQQPSSAGAAFAGLPAIGFVAVNYINANVTPGVLSNYSAVYPHRSSASCTNSTNPQNVCQ